MGLLNLKRRTSSPSWAQGLKGWRPFARRAAPAAESAEARETLVRLAHGWHVLARGAGWPVLVEEIDGEIRRVMETIAKGGLNLAQYERLGARIETMVWLRELPAMRAASYDEILAEMREESRPARRGPEGPVPWDDEALDDRESEG